MLLTLYKPNTINRMKHFYLFILLIAFVLQSNAITTKATQSLKELTTEESTLNWMKLKKVETLYGFLDKAKIIFDLDELSELKIVKVETDELGWKHHRTQQYFNGIPIEGAEFIIHEKDGYVEKANGKFITNFQKERKQPSINKQASIDRLLNQIDAKTYIWDDTDFENSLKSKKQDLYASHYPNPELVYMSPDFDGNVESYRLAYKMEVTTVDPFEGYMYYVDAHTGELLHKITTIFHCNAGTGKTNYINTVDITTDYHNGQYRLHNYCLDGTGEGIAVYKQSNTSNFCCASDIYNPTNNWTSNKDAIDVFKGTEYFYNYMRTYHGLTSTDGNGELLVGNVNVKYPVTCSGNACWNAFYWQNETWFSNSASFGGPPVSIDIVAHEFTHGLTYKTANLLYQNESGALNESFSDIFGVVVERLMGPNPNGLDWLVGEDAFALRDMSNPNNSYIPQPDTYEGNHWYNLSDCNPTRFNDYCGVHTNSGVQNFWFYLLSEGGSGTNDIGQSYNVSGIGIVDAAKIAYRNLTVYLRANSSYADAENGSIQAAIDLFGANSNKVAQVKNAWCAVGGGCGQGSITLTSPNGNNVLYGGKVEPITWSIPNGPTSDMVTLEFSLNNGGNWEEIAKVSNSGGYNWLVPSVQTDLATVRVTLDGDFSARDDSDDLFKILSCTIKSGFEINTSFPQRCVNNTISFSNTTSDINNPNLIGVSYKWFVDGILESTSFNFQKVFATSGSPTITLEVEDAITCTSIKQKAMYIRQDLGANFTWDQEGTSNTVNFTANDADAIIYNWTLNNQTISSSNTFSYNFGNTGTYEICLSTNSTCGPSDYCDFVEVGDGCNTLNANFIINDSNICANTTTGFTSISTGGGSTTWSVNGVDEGNGSIFFYEFPAEGSYTLVLKTSNNNNCEDIKSETITVGPSAFQLEGVDNYMNCTSSSTNLDAGINEMQSYQWKLDNTVEGVNKTLTATESGFYTITVTDKCGQSSSKNVLVALNDQDCIRPGDMNADGKVNVEDVIYYGLHYGDCGFEREDQGIDWRNYSGLDWGSSLFSNENVDMKHADCNGNGCVDLADWEAFRVNWLKEHNQNNYPSIMLDNAVTGLSLNLVPNEEETVSSLNGQVVNLIMDLNVESDKGYDLPLYAGYVVYDLDDIEQQIGQISRAYQPSCGNLSPCFNISEQISWLTDGSIDHVSHQYFDPVTKEFKIAFTRLDQQNRVSRGRIGQLGVEITNVIPPGTNGPTEFVIEPVELAFFNAAGEPLLLGQSTSVMSSALWNDQCRNNNVNINNNNNSINYQSVYTTGTITTNGDVEIVNGSNITYGGQRVTLNSGFKARANSDFKVRYACTPIQNNGNKEENPVEDNAPVKEDEKVIKNKGILSNEQPILINNTQPQKD